MAAVAAAQKNREMFAIKKSYSVENGYPSRRRSLVDDARFESFVVKQTKQTVLEEARQRSNDPAPVNVPKIEINQLKNVNSQNENIAKEINGHENTNGHSNGSTNGHSNGHVNGNTNGHSNGYTNGHTNGHSNGHTNGHSNGYTNGHTNGEEVSDDEDSGLTEEEIVLQNCLSEGGVEAEKEIQRAAIVVLMRDGMNSLARIMKSIEKYHGSVRHLETRPNQKNEKQFDLLVRVDMSRLSLLHLIRSLRQSAALESVTLMADDKISVATPWFPRHASELDNCNHLMTKYEPELDMNHPGFADKEYRARRKQIAEIAFSFKYGDTIPTISYTDDEIKTWEAVFNTVLDLMPKHACVEYRRVFAKLQKDGIFRPDRIPQLEEMSSFMKRETGFTLRPAAGLLTARDFLASLAFRVFQSTQYVRHKNSPYHTPEPDCIHELLGHMPLLADPSFAQFSQEIGLASLGASDAEIEKLSTVYWFTVEFGLCKEAGQVKAYGAGLLSSYGELLHAISEKPEKRPFDPSTTAIQPYQDQEYQPIYYVAESFEDAKEKFRRWVATMSRPFEVRYNPHTGRVEVLDSIEKLESLINQLNTEVLHLSNALSKIRSPVC